MQKSKKNFISSLLLLVILFSGIFLPFIASAYTVPTSWPVTNEPKIDPTKGLLVNHVCPNLDPTAISLDEGLVARVVPCIRDTVVYSTTKLMENLVDETMFIFRGILMFAVVAFGISVVIGNTPSLSQSGIVLLLKIGAILMFANKFNNMYPPILDVLENLLNMMAKPAIEAFKQGGAWNHIGSTSTSIFTCKYYASQASETNIMNIWNLIDCYINLLVGGIFSDTTLKMGILGFIIGALFSNSIGVFVGLVGLYMIFNALWTIFRTVYIFLTSYVAFSFMVLVSVIFIPTILFNSTKQYFDGWLRLTISFLLQPVFVFGYLIMFMVAINSAIFSGKHSLYYAIIGDDSLSRTAGDPGVDNGNFYIGKWLNDIGALKEELIFNDKVRVNPSEAKNPISKEGVNTEINGIQMSRSETAEKIEDTMGKLGSIGNLNYFDIGVPVNVVDWEFLAQRRHTTEWDTIEAMPATTAQEIKDRKAAEDKFYLDYKIAVLLAFLMAAIAIYVFYSLIEYLPFIGTATLGDGGIIPFGKHHLAPTGSRFFGGG